MRHKRGDYPVGILSVLRDLGCRRPVRFPVFSIPDTDNVRLVSHFPLPIIPFSSAYVCTA